LAFFLLHRRRLFLGGFPLPPSLCATARRGFERAQGPATACRVGRSGARVRTRCWRRWSGTRDGRHRAWAEAATSGASFPRASGGGAQGSPPPRPPAQASGYGTRGLLPRATGGGAQAHVRGGTCGAAARGGPARGATRPRTAVAWRGRPRRARPRCGQASVLTEAEGRLWRGEPGRRSCKAKAAAGRDELGRATVQLGMASSLHPCGGRGRSNAARVRRAAQDRWPAEASPHQGRLRSVNLSVPGG
jgi:hypothetical protein